MIQPLPPRAILEDGIAARAFPGAVCHLSRRAEILFHEAVGTLGYDAPFDVPATRETIYDLASVTKIYTFTVALCILRDAKIALDTSLHAFYPVFDAEITLEHLMAHASGISFPIQALEKVAANQWIERIAAEPRADAPGNSVLYSCTNIFLLARVAENVAGTSLDEIIQNRILGPLGLENTSFAPSDLENVAPTEFYEGGVWRGTVHDEAARSWRAQTGTCAGNAGVFAPAADVARFAQIWSQNEGEILHPDDLTRAFAARYAENDYARGLGFQLDAAFYMSDQAPHGTAGHLGFTGPSLVLNPQSGHVAVVLNNRVHPTRNGPNRLPFQRQISAWMFGGGESA
ncbi:MAG: beta-lactamase family protein [Armatimonadetes bacterium]|nr:beta-lactamase family protein [Armatimonadota bacterium]